jgi:hypothetical protein
MKLLICVLLLGVRRASLVSWERLDSYDNFKGYQGQTNRDDIVTY